MPVTDSISPVNPDDIGRPVGTYRVELLDRHTGRVTERVDASNYITPLLADYMKWKQAHTFHRGQRFAHLGTAVGTFPSAVSPLRNLSASPTMPIEFIAGLSSTVAENTASSWATGNVIAYASRYKLASLPAGGPRGQINEAQSEITLDGVKIVFDYNEDQGNGAINSLAICRLSPNPFSSTANVPALACRQGAAGRWLDIDAQEVALNYRKLAAIDPDTDASAMYWVNNNDNKPRIVDLTSFPADADGIRDLSTLTSADVTLGPTFANLIWQSNSSVSSSRTHYLSNPSVTRYGTDWLMAFMDYAGNLNYGRWTNAGAQVGGFLQVSSLYGSLNYSNMAGIAVVGTKAYITVSTTYPQTGDAASSVTRIDLGTNLIDATLPFGTDANGATIRGAGGMTTDGTDLYVATTHGILKMSTAGAILENYGSPRGSHWVEDGATPWVNTAGRQQVPVPGSARDYEGTQTGTSTIYDSYFIGVPIGTIGYLYGIHIDAAGKLWSYAPDSGDVAPLDGANAFSRTLLASTVNKTNSSTMKWTYELTLPSEWRAVPTHPVPPT